MNRSSFVVLCFISQHLCTNPLGLAKSKVLGGYRFPLIRQVFLRFGPSPQQFQWSAMQGINNEAESSAARVGDADVDNGKGNNFGINNTSKENEVYEESSATNKRLETNEEFIKQPRVLALSPHFCVIDKPADVRMDGDFPITVQRLLLHWFPELEESNCFRWVHQLDHATSGALCVALNKAAAAAACRAFEQRLVEKEYLAVLHGHVDVSRWPVLPEKVPFVEESGALRKKKAKQKRKHAEVSRMRNGCKTNTYEKSCSSSAANVVASEHTTLAESIDWQETVMRENLQRCLEAFLEWKEHNPQHIQQLLVSNHSMSSSDQSSLSASKDQSCRVESSFDTAALRQLHPLTAEDFAKYPKKRKLLRKFLSKSCGISLNLLDSLQPIEQQQQHENLRSSAAAEAAIKFATVADSLSSRSSFCLGGESSTSLPTRSSSPTPDAANKSMETSIPPPSIYRYRCRTSTNNGSNNSLDESTMETERVVICIPVAEVPGEFRMQAGLHLSQLDGSDSLTEMEILSFGYYGGGIGESDESDTQHGIPVTKVRFYPRTGRRHQLRLHSLCLGHPIVGDYTYNTTYKDALDHHQVSNSSRDGPSRGNSSTSSSISQFPARMMLHAHRLRVPNPMDVFRLPPPDTVGSTVQDISADEVNAAITARMGILKRPTELFDETFVAQEKLRSLLEFIPKLNQHHLSKRSNLRSSNDTVDTVVNDYLVDITTADPFVAASNDFYFK